jgi:hypothetical protein
MLYFIKGWQRYTQSPVQEFCPTTLEECMQRASAIECNQLRYNKSSSKSSSARATLKSSITFFKCKQHGH